MQKTVVSEKSKVKKEIENKTIDLNTEFRFNIDEIFGRHSHRQPEIWSIRYEELYKKIMDSIKQFFFVPIPNQNYTFENAIEELIDGIEIIINKASSNLDKDIKPLIDIQKNLINFKKEDKNEITLIIKNNGRKGYLEYIDGYIERPGITIDLFSESIQTTEIATLREQQPKMSEKFNHYYNRPSEKYMRNYYISFKRTEDTIIGNFNVTEDRVKYSKFEKLLLKFNLL